jgi:class 3 adenylate cyclase
VTASQVGYARAPDGARIAYQTVGDGGIDVAWMFGFIGHLDVIWEQPQLASFLRELASFGRLILHDRRGTGLSDRVDLGDLGTRMSDLAAVLDAAGSERTVMIGAGEGSALAALFSATQPTRTRTLVMYEPIARSAWAPDYPFGITPADLEKEIESTELGWGTAEYAARFLADDSPTVADDPVYVRWFAKLLRSFSSPSQAAEIHRIWFATDVRSALSTIAVPALVIGRDHVRPDETRHIASLIPGAELVMAPGRDNMAWVGNVEAVLDPIGRFVGADRVAESVDRVLLTILFTDIVGSTPRVVDLGDTRWRDLRAEHARVVEEEIARFRGELIDTAGDGSLATFDSPARAIRCAQALTAAIRQLGIELRAGIHTGECHRDDRGVSGINVHTAARIAALAGPSQIMASRTVTDLVAGSGLRFRDAGTHTLRGIPGEWSLYTCDAAR